MELDVPNCKPFGARSRCDNLVGWGHPLVDADEIVERFYRRAEELRSIAACTNDPDCRAAMIQWAVDYERMAAKAIEQSTPSANPSTD